MTKTLILFLSISAQSFSQESVEEVLTICGKVESGKQLVEG